MDDGLLIAASSLEDLPKGLVVAEVDDQASADALAANDPADGHYTDGVRKGNVTFEA